ncbi:hypothetical protein ACPTFP_30645, partial [Pseudomonas aeruginosa]|uniref:hypothetical protein n=1 Tax=Pseudomonas aeruginosa TaxID=287 RepID=UPI003CC66DC8
MSRLLGLLADAPLLAGPAESTAPNNVDLGPAFTGHPRQGPREGGRNNGRGVESGPPAARPCWPPPAP